MDPFDPFDWLDNTYWDSIASMAVCFIGGGGLIHWAIMRWNCCQDRKDAEDARSREAS